jgi:hypothetical protein
MINMSSGQLHGMCRLFHSSYFLFCSDVHFECKKVLDIWFVMWEVHDRYFEKLVVRCCWFSLVELWHAWLLKAPVSISSYFKKLLSLIVVGSLQLKTLQDSLIIILQFLGVLCRVLSIIFLSKCPFKLIIVAQSISGQYFHGWKIDWPI